MTAGSCQLLVGPASFFDLQQMKVRSSTRATSFGLLRTSKEFGRFWGSSQMAEPEATISSRIALSSASLPSHQKMASGWVMEATSLTHSTMAGMEGCLPLDFSVLLVVFMSLSCDF